MVMEAEKPKSLNKIRRDKKVEGRNRDTLRKDGKTYKKALLAILS